MTVQECLDILTKIEDKSIPILIDCAYCGKAIELRELDKVYVASTSILHR